MTDLNKQLLIGLETIKGLTEEQEKALTTVFSVIKPSLFIDTFISDVASNATSVGKDKIGVIIRTLCSLYTGVSVKGLSSAEFVDDVIDSFNEGKEKRISSKEKKSFSDRLARFLSFENSLGITSKAWEVMTEHGLVYCDSRILTDIRPVFENDPNKKPNHCVLVHTLRLSCHENRNTHRELFIAMDETDLYELAGVVDRAIRKGETLHQCLVDAKMTDMSALPENDESAKEADKKK
jgi:hypothetical protein